MTERSANRSLSGGWSASGNLRLGDSFKRVSLQCNFPISSDYTVEFSILNQDPSADLPIKCEAEITWSVEGNNVKRVVSVYNGLSVTGVGQACKVVIYDLSEPLPVEYIVSVQVAPGVRGSFINPPILEREPDRFVLVPGGGVIGIPLPQNSGIHSVGILISSTVNVPIPDQAFQVSHLQALNTLKRYDPRQFYWVPVSAGTSTIQLANFMITDIFASVTFGIDG